jgi:hypothetical protein
MFFKAFIPSDPPALRLKKPKQSFAAWPTVQSRLRRLLCVSAGHPAATAEVLRPAPRAFSLTWQVGSQAKIPTFSNEFRFYFKNRRVFSGAMTLTHRAIASNRFKANRQPSLNL